MAEAGAIELVEEELFHRLGAEAGQDRRVGDAGADFLVDGQGEGLHERGLADEHQIVRAGKVFAEQTQFAQAVRWHEVGIVNDGHEHLARAMDAEGLLHQEPLTVMVAALELDLEGFAEDAQRVVIRVQGAVDDGCDHPFGIVGEQRLLEDAFAGAGFAEDEAQAALLGVNAEDVEDFLLVRQQSERFSVERMALEAEVGADHTLVEG